jgi:hypothetical protein
MNLQVYIEPAANPLIQVNEFALPSYRMRAEKKAVRSRVRDRFFML